jgi:hypothetical protein
MKRRKFIQKVSLATAGAITLPYILPTGRLFAATGAQKAKHVVFVLFAGGVRQQESIEQLYLAGSQGLTGIEGNIMYNMLDGQAPTNKIVYGTDPQIGPAGSIPIPKLLPGNQTFESMGTLFKEVRSTVVGHFYGLNVLLTGSTGVTQGLKRKPLNPTIFEYTRRYLGLKATDVWFLGNGLINSVPILNYSQHPNFGSEYGANFFAPKITFGNKGIKHLSNSKIYHPQEELSPMYKMKYFLDNSFKSGGGTLLDYGIVNTEGERVELREFMKEMFKKGQNGTVDFAPVSDNGDLRTLGYAGEVIKWFQPTLTVVNLNDVDVGHSDFTRSLRNLHRADHGVAHLWNVIQNTPGMKNDTVMILIPECGRNLSSNPILDDNDWYAYDHSDKNAHRIFSLMLGAGVPAGEKRGDANSPLGSAMDGVMTVADILGFKNEVMNTGLVSGDARSLFDRL